MTVPPPSADDPYRVPSAFPAYAGPSPSEAGAPWPAGQGGQGGFSGLGGFGGPGAPGPAKSRPSWVAWVALGLSALSFVLATSIGIIYAANTLSASDGPDGEGLYYDAGMPSWGSVELTDTGDVEEFTLTESLDRYLKEGIEEFGGRPEDISDITCEALVQPKKNSVGTCSVVVQDVDSTVVLFFLNDQGAYLATLY